MTVDEFIEKWRISGGKERANSQLFIGDLCQLLDLPTPRPTQSNTAANDYVFERHVVKTEIDGTASNGCVDCYKRDSFILEAKQGSDADRAAVEAGQGDSLRDFFGQTAADRFKRGRARRGTGHWLDGLYSSSVSSSGWPLPPFGSFNPEVRTPARSNRAHVFAHRAEVIIEKTPGFLR